MSRIPFLASAVRCSCQGATRRGFLASAAGVAASALAPERVFAQASPAQAGRIDTHHHFYPPESKKYGGLGGPLTDNWSPQVSLDEMDKNGVETSILSVATAPMAWFRLDVGESRGFVRGMNEYGAKMAADHKGRYGLFAFLSMIDVEGTLKEIEYAFDTLKADGVGIATGYLGAYPGDPKFAPIFDELNRRRATVYFHPTTQPCCAGAVQGLNDSVLEVPHDTARAIMSLLLSGSLPKWRDIKFLWSHGGGTVPMLAERIEWLIFRTMKDTRKVLPDGALPEFRRFYYDTANAGYPGSMAALMKIADVSHIVFGTDFPYVTTEWNMKALRRAGITDEQIRAIESENARPLIPRLRT